jgi:hypothetical protein
VNFRGLLRFEIWSNRTTRKIFAVIGLVIVVFCTWCAIERYWLTPGERNMARKALTQIDSMQNFDSMSNETFNAEDRQAKSAAEVASQTARTWRDKRIALGLWGYLGLTEINQDDRQRRKLLQPLLDQKFPNQARSNQASALDMETMGKKARLLVRLELHNALD